MDVYGPLPDPRGRFALIWAGIAALVAMALVYGIVSVLAALLLAAAILAVVVTFS